MRVLLPKETDFVVTELLKLSNTINTCLTSQNIILYLCKQLNTCKMFNMSDLSIASKLTEKSHTYKKDTSSASTCSNLLDMLPR